MDLEETQPFQTTIASPFFYKAYAFNSWEIAYTLMITKFLVFQSYIEIGTN